MESDRLLFRTVCREYSNLFKLSKRDHIKDQIANCAGNQRSLFRIVDSMLCTTGSQLPVCDSPLQLASDFNRSFIEKIQEICKAFVTGSFHSMSSNVSDSVSRFSCFKNLTDDDIIKVIMSSPKSSSIVDVLPTRILVDNIDVLIPFITCLFNCSLSEGIFPDCFKTACVRPLLKKPSLDSNVLRNYRPVSNLPFLSKVLERVVAGQLLDYMNDNHLFNSFQSAYRPFHSCETALLKVQSDIFCALDERCVVIHVMLDLSAAFDTLDHDIYSIVFLLVLALTNQL